MIGGLLWRELKHMWAWAIVNDDHFIKRATEMGFEKEAREMVRRECLNRARTSSADAANPT